MSGQMPIIAWVLGALLLTGFWLLLARGLIRVIGPGSPEARFFILLIPMLAGFGSLPRLLPDHRAEILLGCFVVAALLSLLDLNRYRTYRSRLLSDCRPMPAAEAVCRSLCKQLGMAAVPVEISAALQRSPVVIGLRRPKILFPAHLAESLDADEIRVLIAHELAHIRRHDIARKWLLLFLRRLAFWNPLITWPYKWLCAEMECACDQIASRLTGKPGTLARTLCKIAEPPMHPSPCIEPKQPDMVPGAGLELCARIQFLARSRCNGFGRHDLLKTGVILLLFSILCLKPGALLLMLAG